MDEQKRLLVAVVLSVVVLVGYQYFFATPPEVNNPSQEIQNQEAQNQEAGQNTAPGKKLNVSDYTAGTKNQSQALGTQQPAVIDYRTIFVSTPLYEIAISEHMAAVKSFELKNYKETNKKDSPLKQLIPEQLINGTLSFTMENDTIQGLANAVY